MNIYGYEKRIERAKQMIKNIEKDKGNDYQIKRIQIGISNLKDKIKILKKQRKKLT